MQLQQGKLVLKNCFPAQPCWKVVNEAVAASIVGAAAAAAAATDSVAAAAAVTESAEQLGRALCCPMPPPWHEWEILCTLEVMLCNI